MIRSLKQDRFFLRTEKYRGPNGIKIFRFKAGSNMGLSIMGNSLRVAMGGMMWRMQEIFTLGVLEITQIRAEELMPGVSTYTTR